MRHLEQAFDNAFDNAMVETERHESEVPVPQGVPFAPNSEWEYGESGAPEWDSATFTETFVKFASGWSYELAPIVLPDYWRIDIRVYSPEGDDDQNLSIEVEDDEVYAAFDLAADAAIEEIGNQVNRYLWTEFVMEAQELVSKYPELVY